MQDVRLTAMPVSAPEPLTHIAIAIPVRNEAERIGRLLAALGDAARHAPLPVQAVILANNCTDTSVAVARSFSHSALDVALHEITFATPHASAGRARRRVMDIAAQPGGLLMTTDADAIPCRDWIVSALTAARGGADLVCGPISAQVPHVLATPSGARITRAERAYAALQHKIRHCLDQIAGRQPLSAPRPHYMESGASMAIRADRYLAVGGLPEMDHSEDRALVHRAETHGLTVRYSPDMKARVSARLKGRADGGMAACLRHRMSDHDPLADQAMLHPRLLRDLWSRAMAGAAPAYPDRSLAPDLPMRASDLEAGLPELADLYQRRVRPDFDSWLGRRAPMVAE